MNRLTILLGTAVIFLANVHPVDAGVIYTATYEGHTYKLLDRTPTWHDAEAEAIGLGGHLVTINNADENAWILATFQQPALNALQAEIGGIAGIPSLWLGYIRDPGSPTWYWVSGENSLYTNWKGGEPGMGPAETTSGLVLTTAFGNPGEWHDILDPPAGHDYDYGLVEISAAAVPEPASLTLFGLGALGLVMRRRRLTRR